MKIECPSCHLVGNFNELGLPPDGRNLNCPRCKNSFHVVKPPDKGGSTRLMNSCPSCNYSTFTDEMFAICPKCGLSADDCQEISRKRQERERVQLDQEVLNRSYRNPDLNRAPAEEPAHEPPRAAQPVQLTALLCILLGAALFCYGITGLVNYYSKDWQAVLSEPLLEPVSNLYVFFSLGFLPWLATLYSIYFILAAVMFLKLKAGSRKRLSESAWAGIAVAVIYEAAGFVHWVRIGSSNPAISYYAVGVLSALFMTALLAAPFLILLWYLESDVVVREFKKSQRLSHGELPNGNL
jgi:predicted Zn finger-like uncharacterized protein